MSGAHITFDDQEVRAKLAALLTQVDRPERALHEIGEYLLRATDNRFRREVAPDGTPWAQLADITLLRRLAGIGKQGGADGKPVGYLSAEALADLGATRGTFSKRKTKTGGRTLTKKGQTVLAKGKILHDTGALQGTIRFQITEGGRGVEVGTDRKYGAVQQFGAPQGSLGRTKRGGPIPWGDIPPRPYLGVSDEDRERILEIIEDYLSVGKK